MRNILVPAIFAFVCILFLLGYLLLLWLVPMPVFIKVLAGFVFIGLSAALLYVLVHRYKEIKEESKDDISNY